MSGTDGPGTAHAHPGPPDGREAGARGAPVTVLYIVGKGRSGSTILDHTLGQVPGVASTGELWHLWEWGVGRGARCGCGEPVPDCPVWSATLAKLDEAGVSPAQALEDQRALLRWPNVPFLLTGTMARRAPERFARYTATLSALYRSIAEVRGASVVVDSSKWPAHPGMLGQVPGVVPMVLHLVRDPRAVAHSYRRKKSFKDHDEDPTPMPRFGGWHSGLSWTARNLAVEIVRMRVPAERYRLLRYEELVSQPRLEVARILAAVGLDLEQLGGGPFLDERTARLEPTHTVGGNPSKFTAGDTTYRLDDEWKRAISPWHKWTATALSAPLLPRYRYPLIP